MGAIKLWITDIDGTILDETNVFSKRVLETIEKVKKSDTKMVVATGRMFNGAKGVADFLGLDTPVVCYQGAMVKLGDKILHQAPVKEELARDVIKVLREKNIHTNLYNNDELIGLDLLKESVKDQPKKKKMLDIVHVVLGLVFSVFMSVQTYLIVTTQIRTQEITPVLSFPVWMQSLGYFIGCVMFFGFSIRKLIKCFSRTKP